MVFIAFPRSDYLGIGVSSQRIANCSSDRAGQINNSTNERVC
jgi:hypothetical protein